MASKKDLKEIFKALGDQDFKVIPTKNGHYNVFDPQGKWVATSASTPSEGRGTKNFIAQLRRAGFNWPHK